VSGFVGLLAIGAFPATAFASAGTTTVYNSVPPKLGANLLASEGPEAYGFDEFGNGVTLTSGGQLASVTITLSSWGCGTSGTWNNDNCVTSPGSKFTEPITLNVYDAPATDPASQPDTVGSGLPGARILSVTKTFSIPYRPSANDNKCQGTSPYAGAGAWYDSKLGQCFAGLATNVTFNLKPLHDVVPANIVFGIAYNTTDYGYSPYGQSAACYTSSTGCPYDALNIALADDPTNLSVGSDPDPGGIYQNAVIGSQYCDGGAAGTGTFRFDSPSTASCWAEPFYGTAGYYIPAITFKIT
jgi:hypothetical protein